MRHGCAVSFFKAGEFRVPASLAKSIIEKCECETLEKWKQCTAASVFVLY